MKKIPFPTDKRDWHPSLIPGPIALISTFNENGSPHAAPKSWIQMISFEPPVLMFSGTRKNRTEKNILRSKCFGVNFVDTKMAAKVFECIKWSGEERIKNLDLGFFKSESTDSPLINECNASLACKLAGTKTAGSGFVVFGEITEAFISEEVALAEGEEKYKLLDQALFLEDGVYGIIGRISKIKLDGDINANY